DRLEIDAFRIALLAQLHGIAAAQRRGTGAQAAIEILELAVLAARTVALLVRGRDLELLEQVAPEIERQHRRRDALEVAGQDLERLGDLEVRDDRGRGPDHADRVAGRARTGRRCLFEEATQARGRAVAGAEALPLRIAALRMR